MELGLRTLRRKCYQLGLVYLSAWGGCDEFIPGRAGRSLEMGPTVVAEGKGHHLVDANRKQQNRKEQVLFYSSSFFFF